MGVRAPLIMSILIVGCMLGISLWAWPLVPDHALVAVHWALNNQPNGFASKSVALLVLPGMAACLTVLFAFVLPPMMGRRSFVQNAVVYEVSWIGPLLILAVCHVLLVTAARGYKPDTGSTVAFAVGLVLIVLGNFLGRSRSNPFVGVRTFWTLRSDYSWDKSNRALGRMLVATGLATLASLAIAGMPAPVFVLAVGTVGSTITSAALSYVYWKHDPERAAHP
jgi:uncharacterized membrane protein